MAGSLVRLLTITCKKRAITIDSVQIKRNHKIYKNVISELSLFKALQDIKKKKVCDPQCVLLIFITLTNKEPTSINNMKGLKERMKN